MRYKCFQIGKDFETGQGQVAALTGIDLETREGEFLSIVGPSGCGKTTLLRILAGLLAPTTGNVERICSPGDNDARALVVFQEKGLFPWMTVLDNATFGLEMQGVGAKERRELAREYLRRFGLGDRENAYPNQLSSGMKQRVSVVRAFVSRPSVLLMDEPFAALDYQTRLILQQDLLRLWDQEHKSVIFITHDIEEAILLSDRIVVMSAQPGQVVSTLRVDLPRPRHPALTSLEEFSRMKMDVLTQLGLAAEFGAAVVGEPLPATSR